MRICLVGQKIPVHSRSSDTGLLWPLAKGLNEKGHEVTIISSHSPIKKYEVFRDGIRAYFLYEGTSPFKKTNFIDAVEKQFAELHELKKFDLVHSLDGGAIKIGRHKKNHQVHVAYDIEATRMSDLFSLMGHYDGSLQSQMKTSIRVAWRFLQNYFLHDRMLLDTADGIFTTTPQQRTILERYFLYPDYHTYTVPYGINLGDLSQREESQGFKLKLQIPENAKIVLSISNFTNPSEFQPLLKAFSKLILKTPSVYLVLLGQGPRWKDVEYMMLKKVLGSRVMMPGAVDASELLEYISLCSIYIDLSSQSTGLEPTLIEAMAQKKIVIGSELSPVSEIIEEGQDGFLVRPADENTLFKLMSDFLENPLQTSQVGERAREKVLHVFNRDKMIEGLLDAYTSILERSELTQKSKKPKDKPVNKAN
jgi:glycosyltransferase involved in cell wall biosynthesis